VMFSSRMLSVAGGGPAGTGVGSGVGDLLLSGRKIVLKPLPFQPPTNATSGPRLGGEMAAGGGTAAARGGTTGALGIGGTSPNTKSSGTEKCHQLIEHHVQDFQLWIERTHHCAVCKNGAWHTTLSTIEPFSTQDQFHSKIFIPVGATPICFGNIPGLWACSKDVSPLCHAHPIPCSRRDNSVPQGRLRRRASTKLS
jgi:hypothetical protein